MLAALASVGCEDCRLPVASAGARICGPARDAWPCGSLRADILLAISISLPAPEIAWSRDLRPNLGIVAALSSTGDAVSAGYGAITGQSCAGHGYLAGAIDAAAEVAACAREIVDAWAAGVRVADEPRASDPVHVRHVLGVLMRWLLVRLDWIGSMTPITIHLSINAVLQLIEGPGGWRTSFRRDLLRDQFGLRGHHCRLRPGRMRRAHRAGR